ncbi:MAG: glycosyltransferase family 2 protein [Pseudomonadota bacterium]
MSLTAIIPAHNEGQTIAGIVTATVAIPDVTHVLVVNDGSTDQTAELAHSAGAAVIGNDQNLGKGPRLVEGMAHAFEQGAERVLLLDGDGQHDPDDIPAFRTASNGAPDDLIMGSRAAEMTKMPRSRANGIRFGDFFIGWACGQRINDAQCGMRLIPKSLWQRMTIPQRHAHGFVYETAMLIYAANAGARIVPVAIKARYDEVLRRPSHFKPAADFAKITWMVTEFLILHGMRPSGLLKQLGILR